jgi:hypothetical protein
MQTRPATDHASLLRGIGRNNQDYAPLRPGKQRNPHFAGFELQSRQAELDTWKSNMIIGSQR